MISKPVFGTTSQRFEQFKANDVEMYSGDNALLKRVNPNLPECFNSTTERSPSGPVMDSPGPTAYDLPSGVELMLKEKNSKFSRAPIVHTEGISYSSATDINYAIGRFELLA